MLEVNGLLKFAEKDVYKEGCIPETGFTFLVDVNFSEDTQKELITKICDFLGIEEEGKHGKNYEINSCEEEGRIDFSCLENGEGYQASENEIERWKEGKLELWNCSYSAKVYSVKRELARLI